MKTHIIYCPNCERKITFWVSLKKALTICFPGLWKTKGKYGFEMSLSELKDPAERGKGDR